MTGPNPECDNILGEEMTEHSRLERRANVAANLRKRAAHWRRVALLVSDAVVTHGLRTRANSLEKEAENIDRQLACLRMRSRND